MRHVAIVGATGAVGQEFRKVLSERKFPADKYTLLASARSAGKTLEWVDGTLTVQELTADAFDGVDIALFSAGGSISKEYAPIAKAAGAVVVDNSSAFRMDPEVPLVVPEVNPDDVKAHQGIIANPNCSTIIMLVPLWPLHREVSVRRVVVDTYQAASGAGAKALEELETQSKAVLAGQPAEPKVFPFPCAFNVFSHNTAIDQDGFNVEEVKMIKETHKIFRDTSIQVAPTCMRVPVMRAHTEALSIEFADKMPAERVREILASAPGVKIVDDREKNHFPMPLEASNQDDILVGRIRQDPTIPDQRGVQLMCCGDQLLKGAALNAVQIAELLV